MNEKNIVFTFAYNVSKEFVESILSNLCLSKASNALRTLAVIIPSKMFLIKKIFQ